MGALLLGAGVSLAEAEGSGSITWEGKSITCKVKGASTAKNSSSADDDRCVLTLDIDGNKHELVVTEKGLEYQGKKVTLNSFFPGSEK